MILKCLYQNKTMFLIVFILTITAIIIMNTSDKSLIEYSDTREVKQEPSVVKEKVEVKTQMQVESLIVEKKMDFLGEDEPFVYVKPELEIDELMSEQKKLDTFSQQKNLVKNKEDFMFDYKIGLEDDAVEKLKSGEHLNSEMINGKIEFSKSF